MYVKHIFDTQRSYLSKKTLVAIPRTCSRSENTPVQVGSTWKQGSVPASWTDSVSDQAGGIWKQT